MYKNTIQFQKGIGIMQFLANYDSEDQCGNARLPGSQDDRAAFTLKPEQPCEK